MKSREEIIEFDMQYCEHYARGIGADMACKAGMDIKSIQKVATGARGTKWGPCIEGHTLENPTSYCPKWQRRSRERAEKRANSVVSHLRQLELAQPVITAWRKKLPIGKQETIECPVCKGKLHLSQSDYNGHVHARCETTDCINFME